MVALSLLQLPIIGLSVSEFVVLFIASFAGGLFGAALGALPAFIFTGIIVITGEAANVLSSELSDVVGFGAGDVGVGITGLLGYGPVFGPHVAFAGGAAATAYAAKNTDMDTGFDYHEGKNILYAFGTEPDVLIVGGLFGVFGMVFRQVSGGLALPWDPIVMGVTVSALLYRVVFGYPLVGSPRGDAVVALLIGTVFGIYGALAGEVHQRIFYAHSDTHWDPPAAAIVLTTFTIAVLAIAGVFPGSGWVPVPV